MPCKRPSFPRLPLDSLLDVRVKLGALMSVKSVDYVLREHGMKAGSILMAMWLAAASLSAGAAQLYQWKDAQGRTVKNDQPPPPNIKNAQQKTNKGNGGGGGGAGGAGAARGGDPGARGAGAGGI